jgi:hypothetical protein
VKKEKGRIAESEIRLAQEAERGKGKIRGFAELSWSCRTEFSASSAAVWFIWKSKSPSNKNRVGKAPVFFRLGNAVCAE